MVFCRPLLLVCFFVRIYLALDKSGGGGGGGLRPAKSPPCIFVLLASYAYYMYKFAQKLHHFHEKTFIPWLSICIIYMHILQPSRMELRHLHGNPPRWPILLSHQFVLFKNIDLRRRGHHITFWWRGGRGGGRARRSGAPSALAVASTMKGHWSSPWPIISKFTPENIHLHGLHVCSQEMCTKEFILDPIQFSFGIWTSYSCLLDNLHFCHTQI